MGSHRHRFEGHPEIRSTNHCQIHAPTPGRTAAIRNRVPNLAKTYDAVALLDVQTLNCRRKLQPEFRVRRSLSFNSVLSSIPRERTLEGHEISIHPGSLSAPIVKAQSRVFLRLYFRSKHVWLTPWAANALVCAAEGTLCLADKDRAHSRGLCSLEQTVCI